MTTKREKKVFLIGIAGSGMSVLAELLHLKGYIVSGSDNGASADIKKLTNLGIKVFAKHAASNIKDVDAVVYSTAITPDNPEMQAAKKSNIPLIHRSVMLNKVAADKKIVAIAGSHGKTTTTALLAHIFSKNNLQPSFAVGGKFLASDSSQVVGAGEHFILEADESDGSFLNIKPHDVIVTNINNDHLDNYEYSFDNLKNSFVTFINSIPSTGLACLCIDNPEVKKVLPSLEINYITYGTDNTADYQITNTELGLKYTSFTIKDKNNMLHHVKSKLPGQYNVLNTAAAFCLSLEKRILSQDIIAAISSFIGVQRRFNIYNNVTIANKKFTVVDDYGHHPYEINSVLETINAIWPKRRCIMIYQPHRYSRTKMLANDILKVLKIPNLVILLDVYAASEKAIPGFTSADFANKLNNTLYLENSSKLINIIDKNCTEDDILVFQGAGDIALLLKSIVANNN